MLPLIFIFLAECLSWVFAQRNIESAYPWKYDNMLIEGPEYWGVHAEWTMCAKGKLQSPIDIRPSALLFDPSLKPVHIDKISVLSEMVNAGQMPRVRIGNSLKRPTANLTGGPLNSYRIDIHFGVYGHSNGSEHAIDGRKFPMELQLLGFNTDLYTNFSQAARSTHGLAAISFGSETNEELLKLTVATASVQYKGQRVELADLNPWKLLPATRDYVSYEGSMTAPPCDETVQWIVLNEPIRIHPDDYAEWAKLSQRSSTEAMTPMAPNCRSLAETNQRTVRTNIAPSSQAEGCEMTRLTYRATTHIPQKNSHPVRPKVKRYKETP